MPRMLTGFTLYPEGRRLLSQATVAHKAAAGALTPTQADAPAMSAVVIKPNKTGGQGMDVTFSDHGTFNATNATVKQLIEVAFLVVS